MRNPSYYLTLCSGREGGPRRPGPSRLLCATPTWVTIGTDVRRHFRVSHAHRCTRGRTSCQGLSGSWGARPGRRQVAHCAQCASGRRTRRFHAPRLGFHGISGRMLTLPLRTLARAGLADRTVCPTVPPCVDDRLTESHRSRLTSPIASVELVSRMPAPDSWGSSEPDGDHGRRGSVRHPPMPLPVPSADQEAGADLHLAAVTFGLRGAGCVGLVAEALTGGAASLESGRLVGVVGTEISTQALESERERQA
ncbi:winged helix-turn-helix transcriptional regulator [Streptomyces diastaticus]|uniref:winged helix-turn-helix transcriptional regulator n=1 Tax=Streptomyces diastaticus TaxID=1956 RepID=UPI0036684209